MGGHPPGAASREHARRSGGVISKHAESGEMMAGEGLEREVAAMPWQYGVELAAIAAAYLLVYVVSIQFRHPAAEKLPLRKRQAYDNALISGVHSLISSILVVMCLCGSPIWDEFLLGCSPFLRFTLIH